MTNPAQELFEYIKTEELQAKKGVHKANYLFASLIGSRMFNLHHKSNEKHSNDEKIEVEEAVDIVSDMGSSDFDLYIVYSPAKVDLLGLNPPKEFLKNDSNFRPDYNLCDIRRFIHFLLIGDPRCVELLFADKEETIGYWSEQWEELVKHRHHFLTKRYVDHSLRFAHSNIRQLRSGKRETLGLKKILKKAYLISRTLVLIARYLDEQNFRVWFDENTPEYERIMTIRNTTAMADKSDELSEHELDLDALLDENEAECMRLDELAKKSDVPEDASEMMDFLGTWILRVREKT